jgi:hypothetical protein
MRCLQLFQLLHQTIKFCVGEFRGVQDVVKMFVMADRFAQLVDLTLHGLIFHPIFHSIVRLIFGGSCHGLIIFRSAVVD